LLGVAFKRQIELGIPYAKAAVKCSNKLIAKLVESKGVDLSRSITKNCYSYKILNEE